jgi:Tfp pilus assembly protein PilX
VTRRAGARSEAGFMLPAVVMVLLIGILLAGAVIAEGISANHASRRDSGSKRALQAAQAAVQVALWRTNTFTDATSSLTYSTTCPIEVNGTYSFVPVQVVAGRNWCPVQSLQLAAGETAAYRTSSIADTNFDGLKTTLDREIVATGTADGVTRRLMVRVSAFDINPLFGDYVVASKNDLNLGNSASVAGNTRSDGNINLTNSARICGNATPGIGDVVTIAQTASICPGFSTAPATTPMFMPDVDMTSVRTTNDDGAISLLTLGWSATTKQLNMSGSIATLVGNTFLFCSLTMTGNSTLTFTPLDPTKPIRVYIEDPSRCSPTPAQSLNFQNNPAIVNTSVLYPIVQFFVVGSSTPTTISLANNNVTPPLPITLYAPHSNITVSNQANILGGVAGNQVTMQNLSQISAASNPGGLNLPTHPVYSRNRFIECSSTSPTSDVDGGC